MLQAAYAMPRGTDNVRSKPNAIHEPYESRVAGAPGPRSERVGSTDVPRGLRG
jgi:hypothetical protein